MMRRVYPGFVQLYSFMAMNEDKHRNAHYRYFQQLVRGDGDAAGRHREFYDEYLSVLDLSEEFYLQTIDYVFQRYLLPLGQLEHRGRPVRPELITDIALMTVEGEQDDISGVGQTQAAHGLDAAPAGRQARALRPAGGRPLRRVQRPPLPRRDLPPRPRLHPRQRRGLSLQAALPAGATRAMTGPWPLPPDFSPAT
jgi:polyhydroxyalkanoate depolymerase